jgi:hypothetical protein
VAAGSCCFHHQGRKDASFLIFKLLFSKIPGKIYAFEKTWIFCTVQKLWPAFGEFLNVVNHLPQWVVGAGMCNCIPSVRLLRSGSFWSVWKKGRIGSAKQLSWYTFHIVRCTSSYENINLAWALIIYWVQWVLWTLLLWIFSTYVPDYKASHSIW